MISAGYTPEFIRWGCTIRDFKMFLLACMRDRIEDQQNFSMAVMVAVASVFDSKAGTQIGDKLKVVLDSLDREQMALYSVQQGDIPQTAASVNRVEPKDPSGVDGKSIKAWKNAAKVDALMAKLTGRPTGAPWSQATDGNLTQPIDGFKGRIEGITGESILQTMNSMRSRIPAGPSRHGGAVKAGKRS